MALVYMIIVVNPVHHPHIEKEVSHAQNNVGKPEITVITQISPNKLGKWMKNTNRY